MTEAASRSVHGKLAGISFELRTGEQRFLSYARKHLEPLGADDVRLPVELSAWLDWYNGQPHRQSVHDRNLASMLRPDRDLYVGERELHWYRVDDLRDLFFHVYFGADKVEVGGRFFFRVANSRWSDRLRRLIRWREARSWRRRRYPTLISYLVYYPCWWLSEVRGTGHPIHAAGVETPLGVVLLAGASGVGKSTLSIALAAEEDCRLLSDSFVLHRGKQVIAVPEPILLDRPSLAWLGPRGQILLPMGERYLLDRRGFHVQPEKRSPGGNVFAILFPRRGPRTYMRAMDPRLAHQWLSAANLMVNDLRRYWAFAAVWEQLKPAGLVQRREQELAELVEGTRCYELSVSRSWRCEDVLNTILAALERKPSILPSFV